MNRHNTKILKVYVKAHESRRQRYIHCEQKYNLINLFSAIERVNLKALFWRITYDTTYTYRMISNIVILKSHKRNCLYAPYLKPFFAAEHHHAQTRKIFNPFLDFWINAFLYSLIRFAQMMNKWVAAVRNQATKDFCLSLFTLQWVLFCWRQLNIF